MTMIRIEDVEWVRFTAPDLDEMERFLIDFGLVRAERTEDALYMRGSDAEPWIHETRRGEAGFVGIGFRAASAEDLEAAAAMEGASALEPISEPGGGSRVRFSDPDGFQVEVVHGRTPAEPLAVERAAPLNTGAAQPRVRQLQRVPKGPARVKRLGHAVVRVSDFKTSSEWYESRFGFLRSDEVYLGDTENLILAFMRCDRGETPVDHHTFLCVGIGEPGFDHAAFEVEDFDAVMAGQEHLKAAGWNHKAGVGRHILGSQVFDYWLDPWSHTLEHFTDGDLLDATAKPSLADPSVALGTQWGSPPLP
jgi:catechol 2,3-dioxygenase-like lactoylglutathione lyase family enzyme